MRTKVLVAAAYVLSTRSITSWAKVSGDFYLRQLVGRGKVLVFRAIKVPSPNR